MFPFDLHLHSSASDGLLDYQELFAICHQRGLEGIAITDHNCAIDHRLLRQAAKQYNMEFLPAVEIKTNCTAALASFFRPEKAKQSFAIQELLIYGLDTENTEFLELSSQHLACRQEYVKNLCRLITGQSSSKIDGLNFSEPIYLDSKEILQKKGYCGSERIISYLIEHYRHRALSPTWGRREVKKFVTSFSEQATASLADPFYKMDIFQGIKLAKRWGKLVVLAHPFAAKRHDFFDFYQQFLFPQLVEAGLDGLECYYPDHNIPQKTFLEKEAKTYNLILTGGSDFHNFSDPLYLPGNHGITKKNFEKIKNLIYERGIFKL